MREFLTIFLAVLAAIAFVICLLGSANLTNDKSFFHPDGFTAGVKKCQCEKGECL